MCAYLGGTLVAPPADLPLQDDPTAHGYLVFCGAIEFSRNHPSESWAREVASHFSTYPPAQVYTVVYSGTPHRSALSGEVG